MTPGEREAWLEERRLSVGSSDTPMLLGLSKWGGPLTVYHNKINSTADGPESEYAEWGHRLEPAIAEACADAEGLTLEPQKPFALYRNDRYPYMHATPDFIVREKPCGIECKNVSVSVQKEWSDGVPDWCYSQVQHQIAVMEWEMCYVSVLFGGNHHEHFEVYRNDRYIDTINRTACEFWENNVSKLIEPEPGAFDAAPGLYKRPIVREAWLTATPEAAQLYNTIKEYGGLMETAGRRVDLAKNRLKQIIGCHHGITGIASYMEDKNGVRTLRIK